MAVVDKLGPLTITKGYGSGDTLQVSAVIKGNLRIVVYQEAMYEPLLGNLSSENIGWHYDKEIMRSSVDELDRLGGHDHLLDEGVLESDFQGSIIRGCGVKSIEEDVDVEDNKSEIKWKVNVESGIYSSLGKTNTFFGENYYSEICNGSSHPLKEEILLNTIKVQTYKRNENFINTVKESFSYSISVDLNSLTIEEYRESSESETVEVKRNQKIIYLKNFPVKDVEISNEDQNKYEVNSLLGVITLKNEVDQFTVENKTIMYKCVPALECEVFKEAPRQSNISIKPFKFINSNGLIEISNEEKHVQSLLLEINKNQVNLGVDSVMLTATALNSRNQPVDDIEILFTGDDGKDVIFEGNLSSARSSTNGDGKAFAFASFPINNSSLKIDGKAEGNTIKLEGTSRIDLGSTNPEDITVYQLLKIDPFYGSSGIEILVDRSNSNYHTENKTTKITHGLSLNDLNKFKNNKNNLEKNFVRFQEVENDCETVIYNSGYLIWDGASKAVKIVSIDKKSIIIEGRVFFPGNTTEKRLRLFTQNDAGETKDYLQKVLYKNNNEILEIIRPTRISKERGKWILHFDSPLENNPLIAGYRIYTSHEKIFKGSCVDPATGRKIYSNLVKVKVNLPSYFRDRIKLQSDTEESKLGVGSYILEETHYEQ